MPHPTSLPATKGPFNFLSVAEPEAEPEEEGPPADPRLAELLERVSIERKLKRARIECDQSLLERCARLEDKRRLALDLDVELSALSRFLRFLALMQIKGVGRDYAELLDAAGISSVRDLELKHPADIIARMDAVNEVEGFVRKLPTEKMVRRWAAGAHELARDVAAESTSTEAPNPDLPTHHDTEASGQPDAPLEISGFLEEEPAAST